MRRLLFLIVLTICVCLATPAQAASGNLIVVNDGNCTTNLWMDVPCGAAQMHTISPGESWDLFQQNNTCQGVISTGLYEVRTASSGGTTLFSYNNTAHNTSTNLTYHYLPCAAAPVVWCGGVMVVNVGNAKVNVLFSNANSSATSLLVAHPGGVSPQYAWSANDEKQIVRVYQVKQNSGGYYDTSLVGATTAADATTNCPAAVATTFYTDGQSWEKYDTDDTNGPIVWGDDMGSNAATDEVLKSGFDALYTAIREGSSDTVEQLAAIKAAALAGNGLLGTIAANTAGTPTKLDLLHTDLAASNTKLDAAAVSSTARNNLLAAVITNTAATTTALGGITPRLDGIGLTTSNSTYQLAVANAKLVSMRGDTENISNQMTPIKTELANIAAWSQNGAAGITTANGHLTSMKAYELESTSTLLSIDGRLALSAVQTSNLRETMEGIRTNSYNGPQLLQLSNISQRLNSTLTFSNGMEGFYSDVSSNLLRSIDGRLAGLGTNGIGGGDTNLLAALETFHYDNTNLLGLIVDAVNRTNATADGTDMFSYLNTNAASINAQAADTFGPLRTRMEEVQNLFTWDEPEPEEVGGMTVTMVGHSWNFNPLSWSFGGDVSGAAGGGGLAGLFALARQMFGWLICVGYGLMVFKDIVGFVNLMATVNQLSWPNFSIWAQGQFLGTGTGGGGTISALLIPVLVILILGAFAASCLAVSLLAASFFAGDLGLWITTNPLAGASGSVAQGVNLARHFFPFAVLFSTLTAYSLWRVGLTTSSGMLAVFVRLCVGQ